MKKLWLLSIIGLSLLSGAAFGQEKTALTKPKHKTVAESDAIVTQADAFAIFTRAEKILRGATKSTTKAAAINLSGSKPLTRAQAIMQFSRLYQIVRPKVKVTPQPVKVNEAVLRIGPAEKERLIMLVKMGAVGNYGPLATGPGDTLTVAQFGDALGFFLARMAEMTHMPSPKWSPPLMDGRG